MASVSSLMTLSIAVSIPATHATDIEIYKLPDKTQKTVMMMLDTSGSMMYCDTVPGFGGAYMPYSQDGSSYNASNKAIDSSGIEWTRRGCLINGVMHYDRITRLKEAIFTVMNSTALDDSVLIGIGHFIAGPGARNNSTGKIDIPAKPLTAAQRLDIKTYVADKLDASGQTPSANAYAEVGAYMLGTNTTMTDSRYSSYSGFSNSTSVSKNGSNYISPLPTTGQKECSGQAIYFLTDGAPNNSPFPQHVMRQALGSMSSTFPLTTSYTGLLDNGSNGGMLQVGEFAKRLRISDQNPKGVSIKTAVVGFGTDFEEAERNKHVLPDENGKDRTYYNCAAIQNVDIRNACNWGEKTNASLSNVGGYGEGGFFYAKNSDDVVNSILAVVDGAGVNIPTILTGAPTVPIDSTNPQNYLPYAYYASFTPKPDAVQQLWIGNVDKYRIQNRGLVGNNGLSLIDNNGKINPDVHGMWSAGSQIGVKDKIPLRMLTGTNQFARKLLTNRSIVSQQNTFVAQNTATLKEVSLDSLYGTGATATFSNDPKKNYWLNVLGYKVPENATITRADLNKQGTMRQLAATMHSSPILLTQSVTFAPTNGTTVTGRDDYMLFGSTDGMLHVINNETGEEKFAFLPNEMMERNPKAFLSEELTGNAGRNNLFYGVDAPWTVYTQYVEKTNGDGSSSLTVGDSGRTEDSNATGGLAIKGLQWAYGGLRMGGKSYYALDLSDISNPKLKFQIDPANSKIYNGTTSKNVAELANMGQSWSKPTLGYVNWGEINGKPLKKLVMFVGGGYDATGGTDGKGYETSNYKQTNKQGAGVYMFDANTGDLLWWTSAQNAGTSSAGVQFTSAPDIQYSVVSRINTIDRDGDGLIDNLYFGDLGGQAFRVDLDNTATSTSSFGKRVVRLFNENKADGTSPRFYEMPSFSPHSELAVNGGDEKRFGVVAFSSGDMSSPFSAGTYITSTGQLVNNPTAQDGVFIYYDNDIAKNNLFASDFIATTLSSTNLALADFANGVPQKTNTGYNRGWKYLQTGSAGRYKSTGEPYASLNLLFVNLYDKDGAGISGDCGGGVRGNSYVQQFCLPSGKCNQQAHGFSGGNSERGPIISSQTLGAGIVRTTRGGTSLDRGNVTGIQPQTATNCASPAGKMDPLCQSSKLGGKVQNLRWFESK
ncbi:pilus assembly protein PilC [Acinetobacter sp. c1-l78]